jgi:hypothetical protein
MPTSIWCLAFFIPLQENVPVPLLGVQLYISYCIHDRCMCVIGFINAYDSQSYDTNGSPRKHNLPT